MAAGRTDIYIEQGATFRQVFTWENSVGTPINLTGYTARMQIRSTIDAAVISATLTDANGGLTLGGAAGTISLYLSDTATTALTITSGVYDLELVAPGGDVTRLVQGGVSVSREVTR